MWQRITAYAGSWAVAGALALLVAPAPSAFGAIAYPDLQVKMPTSDISIGHPTPTTKTLEFSHITWNSGAGPFEIRPDYNSATGISQGFQALYTMTSPGVWAFDHTLPVVEPMLYNSATYDYRFPLTAFWLYGVSPGGGLGSLLATSPKNTFCIQEDAYVGGVPNTPATSIYLPATCENPSGTLGLQVGWGDEYDATDGGENIDVTGLPDGRYWLRAEANPDHYVAESDLSNNITDTEIQIAGDVVTVLAQTHPDSTPPTVVLTRPSGGAVSGEVKLTANASGPAAIESVQFLLDGQPIGPPQASAPYSYTWTVGGETPGTHYLSAQATDANGFVNTAPAVAVSVPFARVGSLSFDQQVSQTATGATTTPSFSTAGAGDVLLALVSSDGPQGQTATVSGAGLTWRLVKRANAQYGDSEIWTATASGPLSNTTVTSKPAYGGYPQQLTVVALAGAAGVGASAAAGKPSGAPTVGLAASAPGSAAFAVGNDWDSATARTIGAGQALLSQYLSILSGDSHWSQYTTSPSSAAGQTLTLNDTYPTTDRWNLAAVEVVPSGPSEPPPPDTQPPTVAIANPVAGEEVSGTVPIAATASDNVAVASVQFYLDGQPLGAPVTSPPYAVSLDTTTIANGTHALSAKATDTSGNVGGSVGVTVVVQNPPPTMRCLVMDVKVAVDGQGTVTTPSFHTAQPGELLMAFVAADGPFEGKQSVAVSGAGLTWKLVKRANSSPGDAEIWTATAPATLIGATVKAWESRGGYAQSLTVVSMQDSAGIGATVAGSAASGAPSVSLQTTQAGSLVYGVGEDWDNAFARTLGVNQVMLHQRLNTATGDTFWAQSTTVQAGPAGSVATLSDTAPTGDRWNLAAAELLLGS